MPIARFATLTVAVIVTSSMLHSAAAGPPTDRSFDPVPPRERTLNPAQWLKERVPTILRKAEPGGDQVSLTISHIEVTQSIQDADHTVPILADRRTYVRVFFDAATLPPKTTTLPVSGKLAVKLPDGSQRELDNVLKAARPRIDAKENGNVDRQRSSASSGLTFLLPADLIKTGSFSVQLLTVAGTGTGATPYSCTNCATTSRSFKVTDPAPPLHLTVVGVSWTYQGRTYEPRALDFEMVRSWLMRAYPISDVIYTTVTKPYPEPKHPHIRTSSGSDDLQPDEFDCHDVNTFVARLRAADMRGNLDRRTRYFGLVYDGDGGQGFPWMRGCGAIPSTPTPRAIGSGPTGSLRKWGWDESGSYGGWYTGHELGHNLGRRHVGGTCGEAGPDSQFPYPDGAIAPASGPNFVGFDPGDVVVGRVLPPIAIAGRHPQPQRMGHDVMSYCHWQWISDYTRKFLFERLTAENNLPSGSPDVAPVSSGAPAPVVTTANRTKDVTAEAKGIPARGAYLHMIARLRGGWTSAAVEDVLWLERAVPDPPATGDTPVVQTIGADGRVLESYPVEVLEFSDQERVPDPKHPDGLISATIPTSDAVAGLRITYAGNTLTERMAGKARPELQAAQQPLRLKQPDGDPKASKSAKEEIAPSARTIAERPVTLSWEASHAEAKPLSYSVQISTDAGLTWETVAVDLKVPHVEIAPLSISEARRAAARSGASTMYRIIASDGFHATELVGNLPK
jgi:hypothetical protein